MTSINRRNSKQFNKVRLLSKMQALQVKEEDDDGGDSSRLELFNAERRKGQKTWGAGPNNLRTRKKNFHSYGCGEILQVHPLLAQSQQFSGDDPSISANPVENSEAKERFLEKRLENQLRKQKKLGLGASKSVTLAR